MLRQLKLIWVASLSIAAAVAASASSSAEGLLGEIEDLGSGQMRLGAIEIDQERGSFSVPGTVIDLGPSMPPVEFLVIQHDGMKAYESLIGIHTDPLRFNLACILVGLEARKKETPHAMPDARVIEGEPVALEISWEQNGREITQPLGKLIQVEGDEEISEDWVYTGSFFEPDGAFAAQTIQVMVGAMHEPWSIVQHRTGVAVGNYGALTSNLEELPPPGTPVVFKLTRLEAEEGQPESETSEQPQP